MFLNWLNKERHYEEVQSWRLFSSKERNFIFDEILCNPVYVNPKEITIDQLATFQKFFEFINKENGSAKIYRGEIYAIDHSKLKGIQALWDIVLQATETKVWKEASTFLVNLNIRFPYKIEDHQEELV